LNYIIKIPLNIHFTNKFINHHSIKIHDVPFQTMINLHTMNTHFHHYYLFNVINHYYNLIHPFRHQISIIMEKPYCHEKQLFIALIGPNGFYYQSRWWMTIGVYQL